MVAVFVPFVLAQHNAPSVIIPTTVSACETYTWSVNNQAYTADTVISQVSVTGDTLYVLSLTINHRGYINDTVEHDRCSYTWRGTTYTRDSVITDTVKAPTGSGLCDTVYQLNLTLRDYEFNIDTVHACGHYTWFDSTYDSTGWYSHFDTIYFNDSLTVCRHIDALFLSIVTTINITEEAKHCGDYTWRDSIYTSTGTYTQVVHDTAIGCDTLYTLNLNILVDTARQEVDSACYERTWRGTRYTESGIYSLLDTNSNTHCITYRSVDLRIKTPRTPELDTAVTGCNSILYTFNSYIGTTTKRFSNDIVFDTTIVDHRWARCYDSTIVLSVTIHKSGYDTATFIACDSFYWDVNKTTYTRTPERNPTYAFAKDTFGCDSIKVLRLTIKPSPVITAINGEWHLAEGETAVLYPTCTSGAAYKWTYGNNTSTADTLRIPNVTGNMDVQLEATLNYPQNNIACHDTSWITLVTYVGINDVQGAQVTLYPNPTVGRLNVESVEAIDQAVIFNSLGQEVLVLRNLGNQSVVDLSQLAKGSYTMRMGLQNGETLIRKFIITR